MRKTAFVTAGFCIFLKEIFDNFSQQPTANSQQPTAMKEKDHINLEARLLEQEHRPFTLIRNYINRKQWDEDDPRRKAVKMALLWRLFFSPGTVAATGGVIAIASLIVLIHQNELLLEQNKKIDNQTYLIEAQRRSTLQFEISEILNRIDNELSREENKEKRLSPQLKSRIIAATVSMKPYRSFENESLSKPYSYEKGQFFTALINGDVNNEDISEILSKGNFSNMILENLIIGNENKLLTFKSLKASNSFFKNVSFDNLNFDTRLDFSNCDFVDCYFYDFQARLFDLREVNARGTTFELKYDKNSLADMIILSGSEFDYCSFQGINASRKQIDTTLIVLRKLFSDSGYVLIRSLEKRSRISNSSIESLPIFLNSPHILYPKELHSPLFFENILVKDGISKKLKFQYSTDCENFSNIFIPKGIDSIKGYDNSNLLSNPENVFAFLEKCKKPVIAKEDFMWEIISNPNDWSRKNKLNFDYKDSVKIYNASNILMNRIKKKTKNN